MPDYIVPKDRYLDSRALVTDLLEWVIVLTNGSKEMSKQEALANILTHLRHVAANEELDFGEAEEWSLKHYCAERNGEE